jgi:hypothetical protein
MFRLNEPFPWTRYLVSVMSLVEAPFEILDFIWKYTHKEAAHMKLTKDVSDKCEWSEVERKKRTCLFKEWIFFNYFSTCLSEFGAATREDRN